MAHRGPKTTVVPGGDKFAIWLRVLDQASEFYTFQFCSAHCFLHLNPAVHKINIYIFYQGWTKPWPTNNQERRLNG